MAEVLTISRRIRIPTDEFSFSFVKSSGPGGQNVNKVNSKAVLRWPMMQSPHLPADVRQRFLEKYPRRVTSAGELILTSQRYRDQNRNVEDCLEKLTQLLESVAQPPQKRRPTKPSAAARARRLREKRAASDRKSARQFRGDKDS